MTKRILFVLALGAAFTAQAGAQSALQQLGPVKTVMVPAPGTPLPDGGLDAQGIFSTDKYNYLIWDGKYKGDWYEWWYYKVVLPGTDKAFYFCYGVVNPWDKAQARPASRSYVSAGNFETAETYELKGPVKDFTASSAATLVKVGRNTATDKQLKGRMKLADGTEVSWDLAVEKEWGVNAMGWTMFQPVISNIFWFPAQASAYMTGTVNWRGRIYNIQRAPAYQDRNWGSSFPKWWAWLVSNHFKNSPGTVLAAGGGLPTVLGGIDFPNAMGIGLRHNGREYAFSPGKGDVIKLDINFGKWEVTARNRRGERLAISAWAPREKFLLLKFMAPQGKEFYDYEALKGNIKVRLYENDQLTADLETDEGGIEFGSAEPQDFGALFTGDHKLQ
ncbi:MAG: hypothetical protein HY952_05525 [Elusimicrobia bacterium]|nr:hypothetical protein [Elusimicrobiota bacterium]